LSLGAVLLFCFWHLIFIGQKLRRVSPETLLLSTVG
jgi:hypothetical protein